ncbi:translocation/assembly module TamB domain-containing protein [Shewanella algidipiscicola]|uniref:autotransporter assembly complex protein TamB n=1 Tax=Shewanella algidipiscicola TaxID=614070 RepID=UPI000D7845A6|nr:translocation/assembly module TamB domain-containing protein [Shewanella algidipiscicola]
MTQVTQESSNSDLPAKTTHKTKTLSARLLRWLKNTIRLVLYLPLLLLVIVAVLFGTPFGSRIAVNIADTLVDGLALSYQSGTLNRQLNLTHARWQMNGLNVAIDDLVLNWRPLCLLQRQVCVEALTATAVSVDIDTDQLSADSPAPTVDDASQQQPLQLPVTILLTHAQLQQIKVTVNEMQFNAEQLSGKASWLSNGLRIHSLDSLGLFISLSPSETAPKDNNVAPPHQQESATTSSPKSEPQTEVAATNDSPWPLASLPQVAMPMPIFIDNLQLNDSQLQLSSRTDKFAEIRLQANYIDYRLALELLQVKHDYGQVSLDGDITLNAHYPMTLHLETAIDKIAELPSLTQQGLSLELSGDLQQLQLTATGQGHINLDLQGEIDLVDPELPYQFNLSSERLMWPLDAPQYQAKAVTLDTQGSLSKQQAKVSAQVLTPYHPSLQLEAKLSHSEQTIALSQLDIVSDMGQLQATGSVSYGDEISWDLALASEALQLADLKLNSDTVLPSTDITGSLTSQGKVTGQAWQIGIREASLQGHVDDYPLRLEGDIKVNNQWQLNADSLIIHALDAQLALSGHVDQQWALKGQLSVPALNLWHPEAAGNIQAHINVSGNSDHPEVTANVDSNELSFSDYLIHKTNIKAFYRPLDDHQLALSIKASDISTPAIKLNTINLGIKGDQATQQLSLQSDGDVKLDTVMVSTFDSIKQRLALSVDKLNLNSQMGLVQLDQPILFDWDNQTQQGQIAPFCWQHQHGKLCLSDTAELGSAGDANVQFNGDVGAILKPILPQNLAWQGPATLDSHFSWAPQQKPQARVDLTFSAGHVLLQTSKRKLETHYRQLQINASLDADKLMLTTQLDAQELAQLTSDIEIGVGPDKRLSGSINIDKIDLQALTNFTPQLETLKGEIDSKLTLSGSLSQPQIAGNIHLRQGQLLAAANPTLLDAINIAIQLQGQTANIQGGWQMGDGKASVGGEIDWRGKAFQGNLTVNGDKLTVIQPPMVIVDVSPALNIQFGPKQLDISGKIDVPSGHINIVQLPEGGVAESSDVVFNDSMASAQKNTSPVATTSKIDIKVGDQLTIDGMGLKGRLQGALTLRQEAFKPPLLYGDVKVVDGFYKFMGQKLSIDTGEVQFVGPIDVPNLNIEAVRVIKSEDVIAGVRISGTPLKPIVTLFSSPAKEQAEILSYIVKGTGFNNNNDSQNNALMMGAALTLGNQLGGGAVNTIGSSATGIVEKFGLSNVQLDTNDDGKVAISGFIGDNLMVKYGIGVFNPGYEMTVRYYLLSQLYLESVSGTVEKSLDIYYNFNID